MYIIVKSFSEFFSLFRENNPTWWFETLVLAGHIPLSDLGSCFLKKNSYQHQKETKTTLPTTNNPLPTYIFHVFFGLLGPDSNRKTSFFPTKDRMIFTS